MAVSSAEVEEQKLEPNWAVVPNEDEHGEVEDVILWLFSLLLLSMPLCSNSASVENEMNFN